MRFKTRMINAAVAAALGTVAGAAQAIVNTANSFADNMDATNRRDRHSTGPSRKLGYISPGAGKPNANFRGYTRVGQTAQLDAKSGDTATIDMTRESIGGNANFWASAGNVN